MSKSTGLDWDERLKCELDGCGIERAADWDHEHVEDRLRAPSAGRPQQVG